MNNRILCLLHMPPPNYGVTIINDKIASDILARCFKADILAINTSKSLEDIDKISFAKAGTLLKVWFTLLFKLINNHYDFCYFTLTPTGVGFYKDLFFVFLLKIFRIKTIFHLHGKGLSKKHNKRNDLFYKFCFKDSKVIILAQSLIYDIEKYTKKEDVYVLPNGIQGSLEDDDFKEVSLNRSSNNHLNLLFLSNMIRSKGVFDAIAAAKILKDKGYNFKFNFIGDWFDITNEEFINKAKELGLADSIQYHGFKSGEDKRKVFKEADIFVYPTFNDTFPLVLLEAMEFGLPIVSTYEGAIPEIVEHSKTGFLSSQHDHASLAKNIEVLINDKDLREKMGALARDKFLNEYTFRNFHHKLINIFHSAINS